MEDQRIIPACEDFPAINAALREIEEAKRTEREAPEPVAQPSVDYTAFDGA